MMGLFYFKIITCTLIAYTHELWFFSNIGQLLQSI